MKRFLITLFIMLYSFSSYGLTRFEDLDKSPIGAYKGQFFFGGSLSLGIPGGNLMSAEDDFAKDTTYTFEQQEITKTIVISHINYSASAFAEYMYIDRFGVRLVTDRNVVIQRTHFGENYRNESFQLYRDISFMLGPTVHATIRKPWDLVFVPKIGVAMATFNPAPCVDSLLPEFSQSKEFKQNVLVYGAAIHGVYYFKNGVFISGGISYTHINLSYSAFERTSPEPQASYNGGNSSVTLGLTRFLITCGYALYN